MIALRHGPLHQIVVQQTLCRLLAGLRQQIEINGDTGIVRGRTAIHTFVLCCMAYQSARKRGSPQRVPLPLEENGFGSQKPPRPETATRHCSKEWKPQLE